MVEKLYYTDPYLKSFDATVTKADGDKFFLDRTAFYPGGGGQANDTGTIDAIRIVEVAKDGEEIFHRVPGGNFKHGQKVHCEVDWARRYELMRGHSGQHILFRAMQEQNPELSVGKVDITIEKKTLFFNGEMSWQSLKAAVARANDVIAADVKLAIQEVPRDSSSLEKVRIKADRIAGDNVRVVRIGDFDSAACGGVHVKSSGEIGGISVVKMVSGRQASDWSVQFEIGAKAIQSASALALSTLAISDSLGCSPENAEPTVANLKAEVGSLSEKLKIISQKQLEALRPEKIGDFSLYYIILYGADRKTMSDTASKIIREPGTLVLMCDVSENAFMLVACNEKIAIDCTSLLRKGLEIVGGKGGGKKNFAQGGGADVSKAEEAFKTLRQSMLDILASQFTCG